VAYHFESLDYPATERRMSAYYVEFQPLPDEAARPHQHPGAEVIYVIAGTLGVTMAGAETELETGDSMYFDSTQPHSYRRTAGRRCVAVVVTAE
jgi:quercetin dioxygenase-like cupin family protein